MKPTLASLNRNWHILVEKPLARTLKDCKLIVKIQKERKKIFAVCHTLRFMDGFRKVKQFLSSGAIGNLVHKEHMEAIGSIPYVHNYVRGRWTKEKFNTFLLLHKCSHDKDNRNWLFSEQSLRVLSFGSSGRYDTNVPTV
jgi:predicted dehydrogenase